MIIRSLKVNFSHFTATIFPQVKSLNIRLAVIRRGIFWNVHVVARAIAGIGIEILQHLKITVSKYVILKIDISDTHVVNLKLFVFGLRWNRLKYLFLLWFMYFLTLFKDASFVRYSDVVFLGLVWSWVHAFRALSF